MLCLKFRLPLHLFLVAVMISTAAAQEVSLKAKDGYRWYRGNMHAHSLWSDGDDYPEMIAMWYREHGYQFLVHTDHNVMMRGERWIDVEKNKGGRAAFDKLTAKFPAEWVRQRTTDGRLETRLRNFDEVFDRVAVANEFLLIQGEEVTDSFGNKPVHLCATNVSELLTPMRGGSVFETIQNNVNAAVSHRERTGEKTLIHLNHPNFRYAVTAEDLMRVIGENFFEVYNGHPSVNNSGDTTHASTSRMWDIINTMRIAELDLPMMYGLATDDGHDYHKNEPGSGSQPGRGWVMVLSTQLTPEAIVEALEAGRFYSSSGVALSEVAVTQGEFRVEVEAHPKTTYQIDFVGTMRDFDRTVRPPVADVEKSKALTQVYSDDVGAVLQSSVGSSATYQFTGEELYVRAVVTSSTAHPNPSARGDMEQAWTQPVKPAKTD